MRGHLQGDAFLLGQRLCLRLLLRLILRLLRLLLGPLVLHAALQHSASSSSSSGTSARSTAGKPKWLGWTQHQPLPLLVCPAAGPCQHWQQQPGTGRRVPAAAAAAAGTGWWPPRPPAWRLPSNPPPHPPGQPAWRVAPQPPARGHRAYACECACVCARACGGRAAERPHGRAGMLRCSTKSKSRRGKAARVLPAAAGSPASMRASNLMCSFTMPSMTSCLGPCRRSGGRGARMWRM